MLKRIKLSHIKESARATWRDLSIIFRYVWLVIIVIFNWSKEFSVVGRAYSFFLPKIFIVAVGAIVTGIPFLFLLPIAFLPVPVVAPIFFVGFILLFKQL